MIVGIRILYHGLSCRLNSAAAIPNDMYNPEAVTKIALHQMANSGRSAASIVSQTIHGARLIAAARPDHLLETSPTDAPTPTATEGKLTAIIVNLNRTGEAQGPDYGSANAPRAVASRANNSRVHCQPRPGYGNRLLCDACAVCYYASLLARQGNRGAEPA